MTTLLEALGVIALISLMLALVYPNFTLGGEKAEVVYMGNLVQADLTLASQESKINQSNLTVNFSTNGYSFLIGDFNINRRFNKYHFSFETGDEEESNAETAEDSDRSTKEPDDSPEAETADLEGEETSSEEDQDSESGIALKFSPDGVCSGISLSWKTTHFSGNLVVDQQGIVKWSYGQK